MWRCLMLRSLADLLTPLAPDVTADLQDPGLQQAMAGQGSPARTLRGQDALPLELWVQVLLHTKPDSLDDKRARALVLAEVHCQLQAECRTGTGGVTFEAQCERSEGILTLLVRVGASCRLLREAAVAVTQHLLSPFYPSRPSQLCSALVAQLCHGGGIQLEVDQFLAASVVLPEFLDSSGISHVRVSWDDELCGEDEDEVETTAQDAALQLQERCPGVTRLDCSTGFFPLCFPPALEDLRWNPFIWGAVQPESSMLDIEGSDWTTTKQTKSLLKALSDVATLKRLELTLPIGAARAPARFAKTLPPSLAEVHVLVDVADPCTSNLMEEEYGGSHILDLAAFSKAAGFEGRLHVTVAYIGYSLLLWQNMLEHLVLPGLQAAAPFHSLKVLLSNEHWLHAKFRACAALYNEGLDP